MKQRTFVLAALCLSVFAAVDRLSANENLAAQIASLEHPDRQIREAAYNLLLDEENEATAPLVAAILEPANSQRLSSAAAIVLVERLSSLEGRWNTADRTQPVINLTQSDKRQLRPLVDYVRNYVGGPGWRWYLAVAVLDEVDAAALADAMPALVQALHSYDPMLQYGATKAIFHNSRRPEARRAKSPLLSLLDRPRPPFQAIYLRGSRLIEDNRVAYANDVRVYVDVDTTDAYLRRERYYGHGDLLISDTLLLLGATFDEIGPRLADMASRDTSSVRLRAIGQLVQLGPAGQEVAALSLRRLLLDRDNYLLRRLADEHGGLVGQVRLDDPSEQQKTVNLFNQLGQSTKLVVAPLTELLDHRDDRVRHVAANILGRIGAEDLPVALNALRVALASEAVAPLTVAAGGSATGETARKLLGEIARHGKVVSLDDLESISDQLVFENPPRPSQQACYRAMLDAALSLEEAKLPRE